MYNEIGDTQRNTAMADIHYAQQNVSWLALNESPMLIQFINHHTHFIQLMFIKRWQYDNLRRWFTRFKLIASGIKIGSIIVKRF